MIPLRANDGQAVLEIPPMPEDQPAEQEVPEDQPAEQEAPEEEEVRDPRMHDFLMVVAITALTMTFVFGISPSRGLWQENSGNYTVGNHTVGNYPVGYHTVGKSVMADEHPMSFYCLLVIVTIIHVTALAMILIQVSVVRERRSHKAWAMTVGIWIVVVGLEITWKISIMEITPTHMEGKVAGIVDVIIGFGGAATVWLIIYLVKKQVKNMPTSTLYKLCSALITFLCIFIITIIFI